MKQKLTIEIITNTDCNWDCYYCDWKNVPDKQMEFEAINRHYYLFDMFEKLRKVFDLEFIVEGGEIGLIEDNAMLSCLFMEIIGQPVIINTNGKFFETDRSDLYLYIKEVYYHVAPDASKPIHIEPLKLPFPVNYGIVDQNPWNIQEFMVHNSHIDFGYVGEEFKELPVAIKEEAKRKQEECFLFHQYISIDLAREVICCCTTRGATTTIPLSEENLKKVLSAGHNFEEKNAMCKDCYRMCKDINTLDIIQRKITAGNVL